MGFFDCEQYMALVAAIKKAVSGGNMDAEEDLQSLKKAVLSFTSYVRAVGEERVETDYAKGVLKGEELQQLVTHFDQTRHTAHEQAIVNARMINRIATAYGVGNIFLGDVNNRREVGSFCGELLNWIFVHRYN